MCWIGKCDIPKTTHEYEKLYKLYKDQMVFKILQERDVLNEQAIRAKERNEMKKAQQEFGVKLAKESVLEMFNISLKEQHFLNRLNERKAEINVIRRDLEIRMIKQAISMIKAEHSSLLATFDQASTDKEINIYIHPQQQFASTLFQSVDRNSHLDVSNKLSFIQSFLTKLRNRCTEVETLTSGPGIVFSMKDFNECLQVFCRGLLKYGEQEMRARVETAALKENQYRHLIYLKDQQNLYYRRKCEQFLKEIDKLINAKLTQKGNQIIYELDISTRELRMLKDSFYLMERMMRQEVKHEYERTIQEKENLITKFKESFLTYKSELNNEIKEEVAREILSLDKKVKTIVKKRDSTTNQNSARGGYTQGSAFGGPKYSKNFSHMSHTIEREISNSGSQQNIDATIGGGKNQGYYDAESRREINSLHKFIRKYKVFTKMKEVIAQEQHERELHNQRQKLTSNECLWEQLAEAEKREQIIRQELYFTQQNLASYEKLIEKLQQQLENLQNQKLRLQQYKNSKSKRIDELESKMRDIEILENIDINKVLEELRSRDKKLHQLEKVDRNFNDKIDSLNKINQKKINEMKKKYEKEKEIKSQAFGRLESLRLEMRALEGRDYTSDLWKEKCKELFDICKELQKENDDIKVNMASLQHQQSITPQPMTIQQQQYHSQTNQIAPGQGILSPHSIQFDNKNKQFSQINSQNPTTKPSTAAGGRLMSRGGANMASGLGTTQQILNQIHQEQTLTSGLSLPEIMAQDTEDNRSPMALANFNKTTEMRGPSFATQTNFNISKSRDTTLKQNQFGQNMDAAFTSAGTLSDQAKKFGKNYYNKERPSILSGDTNSGIHGMGVGAQDQLTTLTSGEGGFRSSGGALLTSGMMSKSQSRGTALIANQTKFKNKRLKTSHGGRRAHPTHHQTDQATSTAGIIQSAQIQTFKDNIPIRKSGGNLHYSRQQQQNITAANQAGFQITHGLPINALAGNQSTIFGNNRGSINLNINFNTTNINMPRQQQQ